MAVDFHARRTRLERDGYEVTLVPTPTYSRKSPAAGLSVDSLPRSPRSSVRALNRDEPAGAEPARSRVKVGSRLAGEPSGHQNRDSSSPRGKPPRDASAASANAKIGLAARAQPFWKKPTGRTQEAGRRPSSTWPRVTSAGSAEDPPPSATYTRRQAEAAPASDC